LRNGVAALGKGFGRGALVFTPAILENRHVFQKSDALSNNFTPIPEIASITVEASPETCIIGVIKQNKNTRLYGERLNMATIAQPYLFSWENVEKSSEIFRLKRVLETLPDGELIAALEADRKRRRDDYPIAAIWNSLIAGIVFGHESIASLRRELLRNAELRMVCGFDPLLGEAAVPGDWVYSRFIAKILNKTDLIASLFHALVESVAQLLPDFGQTVAIDGKALPTLGFKDPDASWGIKTYKTTRKDGSVHTKKIKWFGYTLMLIVDAKHELPISFRVMQAGKNETGELLPMVEDLAKDHPEIYERIEELSGDRGYDSAENKAGLYDDHGILPIIDTRDMHTNTAAGPMRPLDPQCHDTIYIGPTGQVCCKVDPFNPDPDKAFVDMNFMGFEKDRGALKFRCPAMAYGLECKNQDACKCSYSVKRGAFGRIVRVPLEIDRRRCMPVHRHCRTFKASYKRRTSVERVNGRIDQVYGFERHFIRGHKKMTLRISLALITMLATAVAWIKMDQAENMRSLVRTA
jgi:hypothetical protein